MDAVTSSGNRCTLKFMASACARGICDGLEEREHGSGGAAEHAREPSGGGVALVLERDGVPPEQRARPRLACRDGHVERLLLRRAQRQPGAVTPHPVVQVRADHRQFGPVALREKGATARGHHPSPVALEPVACQRRRLQHRRAAALQRVAEETKHAQPRRVLLLLLLLLGEHLRLHLRIPILERPLIKAVASVAAARWHRSSKRSIRAIRTLRDTYGNHRR
eukprot:6189188-Pleurochrysis_carterae.AAC.4